MWWEWSSLFARMCSQLTSGESDSRWPWSPGPQCAAAGTFDWTTLSLTDNNVHVSSHVMLCLSEPTCCSRVAIASTGSFETNVWLLRIWLQAFFLSVVPRRRNGRASAPSSACQGPWNSDNRGAYKLERRLINGILFSHCTSGSARFYSDVCLINVLHHFTFLQWIFLFILNICPVFRY